MASTLRNYIPLLLLVTVLTLYLHYQFEELFECPGCHLFVDSADGLKNYFTPAWYIKHAGSMWFEGMNYPYGEHLVYTDNQPAVSTLLKALNSFLPVEDNVIAILHVLLLLSLVATGIILYAILRHFSLPKWYSALISLPIVLLSPQIARFTGHYSLAYTFYLPLLILLLIRWRKGGFKWWPGASGIVLWIVWMGFTHLYYFFIAGAFLLSFAVAHWILGRVRSTRASWRPVVVALISAIIVYGTVKVTDPVEDRPESVYGIFVYTARPAGTFLPWYEQMDSYWTGRTNIKRPDMEGMSYVGAIATLVIPFALIQFFQAVRRRRRQSETLHKGREVPLPELLFLSGLLVWFIATGWFYSIGGGFLIDVFPVIGQFRSLGRLAWMFYYTYTLYVALVIYRKWKAARLDGRHTVPVTLLAIAIAFWYYETGLYLRSTVTGRQMATNRVFSDATPYSDLLAARGLSASDFQAIFQVPMVSIGSEKLLIERGLWHLRQSFQCSWETGLPIVNSNMSRTSLSQTLGLLQMISEDWIEKRRLRDMGPGPLLLVAAKDTLPLIETEKRLIDRGDYLGSVNDVDLYSLPLSAFAKRREKEEATVVLEKNFEEHPSDIAFKGQGALLSDMERTPLLTFTDTFTTRSVLEYSSWSHCGPRTPVFATIRHQIRNVNDDLVHDRDYSMFRYDPYNVVGDWIETRFYFGVDGSGATHTFTVEPEGSLIDAVRIR